jgi:tetratricopeptide (TPR) repeat protein
MMSCANCGIAEVDDVKLMDCDDGCDLVKYCSDGCQNSHREQHFEECKKTKAELRDNDLFTPPDGSCYGDCPICCLPLPINVKNVFMSCCSKLICNGCDIANQKREYEAGLENRCAFCREPFPKSEEEAGKKAVKRIKKHNCPAAMTEMGKRRRDEGDYKTALEYFTKAAELGDADAHYNLSCMYWQGQGVENDMKKEVYHLEEAAIGGHPHARHNLGIYEGNNGRFDRAKKHFIIAANLGCNDSLKCLRRLYADGHASKEDYADALRAYQAAEEATKSAERKVAEAYYSSSRRYRQS